MLRSLRLGKPVLQDPLISQRSPFETYLLVVGVLAGWGVMTGEQVSQAMAVDDGLTHLWGIFVFVGSLLALLGSLTPQKHPLAMVLGLHVERFGLTLLAGACGVYAWILWDAGEGARLVAAQNAAFSAACVARVVQIARRFRWYYSRPADGKADRSE